MKKNPISSEVPEPEIWAFYQKDKKTGELVEFKTNVPRPDILKEFEKDDPNIGKHDYVFCRWGLLWFIKFGKEKALLEPREGIFYVATALSREHQSVPIDTLIQAQKGYDPLDVAEVQRQDYVQFASEAELERKGFRYVENYEDADANKIKDFRLVIEFAEKAYKQYRIFIIIRKI